MNDLCRCGRATVEGVCLECMYEMSECPCERAGVEQADDYDGAPHPADVAALVEQHEGTAVSATGRTVADIGAEFWPSKPVLGHIRTSAYARLASPWATLGEVLARMLTMVPPRVQLPPTIGGNGSLNLFIAQVAVSGVGKGAAARTASEAIEYGQPVRVVPIGSGEGMVDAFATTDSKGEQTWHTYAATVTIPEVDHLAAEMGRTSSTIGIYLRQGFMGESLGGSYRTKTSRAFLPDHSYRLTLTVGVQPGRAGALLAESAGGTPQRFVWLPATDPMCPDVLPDMPKVRSWRPPADVARIPFGGDGEPVVLPVCQEAKDTIIADQRARQREQVIDPLETHSNFVRLKVAAALSLLCYDERTDGPLPEVTAEYWNLAGLVMEVSSITRRRVADTLTAELRTQNEAQGHAEAARARIVRTAEVSDELRAAQERIMTVLMRHAGRDGGWMTNGELQRQCSRHAKFYPEAIEMLTDSGRVECQQTKPKRGPAGLAYRVALS